ncbi:hypothetical protein [Bacillus horti]|uniref:Uncharacterized protein n=1 Tax=Caldalkalibacillus horti TaxID=77523 RepID=A0ABT9W0G2_9BACI|nr:hypothetical protein [Bacillus horti]MDQ0166594.1 hypothetical protein [Bacillus horti]
MILNIFSISIEIKIKKQPKDAIVHYEELQDPLEQAKLMFYYNTMNR